MIFILPWIYFFGKFYANISQLFEPAIYIQKFRLLDDVIFLFPLLTLHCLKTHKIIREMVGFFCQRGADDLWLAFVSVRS